MEHPQIFSHLLHVHAILYIHIGKLMYINYKLIGENIFNLNLYFSLLQINYYIFKKKSMSNI